MIGLPTLLSCALSAVGETESDSLGVCIALLLTAIQVTLEMDV